MSTPQLAVQPVLRGRLEDLDVGSLLSALRLGRQHLTLEVYDAAGDCTGVVAVKAGQILSASVDGYTGMEAVRRLLSTRDAAEFRVLPQPAAAEITAEPIGTIAAITQAFSQTPDSGVEEMLSARAMVMQGVLSGELRFEDILRGLSFTRQHVTLALNDANGRALGEVTVKANKVLSARAGGLRGVLALQQLQRAPHGSRFVLFVDNQSVAQLHPLGTVEELLKRLNGFSAGGPNPSSNGAHKASAARGRVMEGNLEEFKLSHVLSVLSTSRQHFELQVRDETAATVGVIEVKSGMVVAASTDKLQGVPAAYELLHRHKGHFVAIRRVESSAQLPALIRLSELLQPRATSASEPTQSSVVLTRSVDVNAPSSSEQTAITVMQGRLGELDVASILKVAGSSRQYTCVQIFDDQHSELGAVYLKSGQVVRAQAQDVTDVAAVRRLLHCPSDFSFLVQRYPCSDVNSSIGSVVEILAQASATAPSLPSPPPRAASTTWIGGAVVGAGFVLLGGIATAIVMRPPPERATTISPIVVRESLPAPAAPAPPPIVQREEPPEAEDTPVETAAKHDASAPLTRATVASLQAGLQQLGYATGPIDGVIGPRTEAAIKAFQYAENLTADGTFTSATRAVLLRRMQEP